MASWLSQAAGKVDGASFFKLFPAETLKTKLDFLAKSAKKKKKKHTKPTEPILLNLKPVVQEVEFVFRLQKAFLQFGFKLGFSLS